MTIDLDKARLAKRSKQEVTDDFIDSKIKEAGSNAFYEAKIGEDPDEVREKAEAQGAVFIEWLTLKKVNSGKRSVELLFYIFDE